MASITSVYSNHAKDHPCRTAVKTSNREVSWREWSELIHQTAGWFQTKHIPKKTVGIFMGNGLPFLQLFAGAAAAGWTAVPLDLKWSGDERQKRVRICQPAIIVTTRDLYDKIQSIHPHVLIWEDVSGEIYQIQSNSAEEISGDAPFYMGFTSGSTGEPKAFIRSQKTWTASFQCNKHDFRLGADEYVLVPGALIHSHFLYGAISTLFLGGTVHLLDKFSPNETMGVMLEHPVTAVYLVPTMMEALLKETGIVEKKITFISSGAKWEKESKRRIRDKFPNLDMFEFYGAGELSFVTALSNKENSEKPESVGKPCCGVEIQIRKADGGLAAPYETGKIYVKSGMVCTGYLSERGVQTIQDSAGWSTVDDMGCLDEEGYLYIAGREKNMILYGGINIFPEEIETVLSLHPDVELAAVFGVKDPYWGEIVTAVVKGSASKLELRKLCKEKLASYKIPRKWFFTEDIPLTAGGKIARAELKERLVKEVISHS
ncbi:AMP-binding protein [Bacillus aerolatus]|uniref:AMP-binding protein n=1 Tax=Bacillus aerolatus TaxID=2653354 RepID=A0A6I1FP51_9BACI|nr:AMP-binding protein [Bacillus aerolatus]KAB7705975.1 AMP-binding protein [Bacillus aerolatus]